MNVKSWELSFGTFMPWQLLLGPPIPLVGLPLMELTTANHQKLQLCARKKDAWLLHLHHRWLSTVGADPGLGSSSRPWSRAETGAVDWKSSCPVSLTKQCGRFDRRSLPIGSSPLRPRIGSWRLAAVRNIFHCVLARCPAAERGTDKESGEYLPITLQY